MSLSLNPSPPSASSEPAISFARRAGKRIAFVADDLRRPETGTVVLAYHRVGGRTISPVDLATKMFERQMAHLRASASVITLDELVDGTVERTGTPGTVVTFDDGTADFVDIVLPILVKYQIPATLYLATSYVDTGRLYPADGTPICWSGLRDALDTGLVTIGAHTHTHRLLDRCTLATAADEIDRCTDRIADELGVLARHFAYPKAVAPAPGPVDDLVRCRFASAAIAGTRPNVAGRTDLWRLARSPIQNADGWEGFRRKAAGGMRSEDDLRRVINLVRYRGKSS